MARQLLLIIVVALLVPGLTANQSLGLDDASERAPWHRDPFHYAESSPRNREIPRMESESLTEEKALSEKSHQDFKLKGIVAGRDGHYRALINDREVRQGELISGVRVVRIKPFSIEVDDGGKTREIDLFNHQIQWGDQ